MEFIRSIMSALPKRVFTPEEYLELENTADYKSQYIAGEIFAMAGTQIEHGEILKNLVVLFNDRFRGRPCRFYFQDIRLSVAAGDMYTYPDLMALCGEPKFEGKAQEPPSLLNPQVVFEILSRSTEDFDRRDKFARYRRLETLREYVLVTPWTRRVERHWLRDDGVWEYEDLRDPTHILHLDTVEIDLPLAEIYESVTFPSGLA